MDKTVFILDQLHIISTHLLPAITHYIPAYPVHTSTQALHTRHTHCQKTCTAFQHIPLYTSTPTTYQHSLTTYQHSQTTSTHPLRTSIYPLAVLTHNQHVCLPALSMEMGHVGRDLALVEAGGVERDWSQHDNAIVAYCALHAKVHKNYCINKKGYKTINSVKKYITKYKLR